MRTLGRLYDIPGKLQLTPVQQVILFLEQEVADLSALKDIRQAEYERCMEMERLLILLKGEQ